MQKGESMEKISISGKTFPVIEEVKTSTGETLPLVDIPLMSDETWNRLAGTQGNQKTR